eukprot:CAMPEP_0196764742 /NCGR_PEP_ID=MMETSP1095-20130614/6771_1 /TAXON_ID=96789 ORGANISM="Chromulina nebulosa, Strain UTEXLB2642" /NCGR_SAMPLE_ID=MMETSP1095 /ASSEMBLY_ACC=CAM_ASM_000446 /LENGTH=448 /DNA_ID=CAMNT_0042121087 /DNA_START=133 /DNA_END=1482 /DNA_ORIENTATION=+
MSSLAELRQILKEDVSGKNLYDHLIQVLMKVLQDRPNNAFDSFELISSEIKSNPLDPNPMKGRNIPLAPEELQRIVKWTKTNDSLLKIPEEALDEPEVKFPQLLNDFNLLEWAGISIGRSESYRLFLSIKSFVQTLPSEVERIRFFGKITTRSLPYFIIEGYSTSDSLEDLNELVQEGKSGVNKYTYWVTQRVDGSDGWIKLPHVTSDQIVCARLIRRLLTGDLNANVPSYPIFNGLESNYLRALIAIINGSTSISPDGFYELDDSEDPPVVKPVESESINENFPKLATDINNADSWKHHELEINTIGRVTALPEQTDESGEVIEPDSDIELTPPLNNLTPEDWTFRISAGGSGISGQSYVIAKSLRFPGAVAVYADRKYVNIYIGNGLPFMSKSYTPPLPLIVSDEYVKPGSEEDTDYPTWQLLVEQVDTRVDPTPPVNENEEEEED